MEAPLTENIYQVYQGQPVEIIAAGDDWHQPYGCEDWVESFGLTYPILDDDWFCIHNQGLIKLLL